MNHLDLFSGIGGFSLAAKWAGIETIQFVEIDSFCQKVLAKNFPDVPIHGDIKTFDATKLNGIDLLTGGYPCQPFSCAGKQKGILDDRYLWPEMFRVIKECQPTWIIAENVPGIIPHLDPILEDLEREGYTWQAYLIPASALGAPHKRERLWIIAHRNGERRNNGADNWKERHVQTDWQQYIAKIQSEWTQFFPQSWTNFNAQEWLGFTANTASVKSGTQYNSIGEKGSKQRIISTRENSRNLSLSNTDGITSTQTDSSISTERMQGKSRDTDTRINRSNSTVFHWKEDQPPVPGVDDGLPQGLDRNKSLGNAIVPQIAYIFMQLIKAIR